METMRNRYKHKHKIKHSRQKKRSIKRATNSYEKLIGRNEQSIDKNNNRKETTKENNEMHGRQLKK